MNTPNALPTDGAQQIVSGQTEVQVMKRTINPTTRREEVNLLHKGIVVQQTKQGWLRVYNPSPNKGDVSPETAEWFPLHSRACWCVVTAQREERQILPIPPLLRT